MAANLENLPPLLRRELVILDTLGKAFRKVMEDNKAHIWGEHEVKIEEVSPTEVSVTVDNLTALKVQNTEEDIYAALGYLHCLPIQKMFTENRMPCRKFQGLQLMVFWDENDIGSQTWAEWPVGGTSWQIKV